MPETVLEKFCPQCQEEEMRRDVDKSSDNATKQHQQPHSEADEYSNSAQDEQKIVGGGVNAEKRISCLTEFNCSHPDELSVSHRVKIQLPDIEGLQSGGRVNDENFQATPAVGFSNLLPSEHFAAVQNQNESVCESKEGQSSSVARQVDRQTTGTQQSLKSEDELESTAKVPSVPEQDNSEENQLTTLANNNLSLDLNKPLKCEERLEAVSSVSEQGNSEPPTLAFLNMDKQAVAKPGGQGTLTEGLQQEIESKSKETLEGHSSSEGDHDPDSGSTITTMNATVASEATIAGGRSGLVSYIL